MFVEPSPTRSPANSIHGGIQQGKTSSGAIRKSSVASTDRVGSSMDCMFDLGHRESSTRALIEHEHEKVFTLFFVDNQPITLVI